MLYVQCITACCFCFQLRRSDSIKNSQAALLRAAISKDPSSVASLLQLSLELTEVIVLNGVLKLSVVETRMKMEPGGVERQALRLGKDDRNCVNM